MNGLDLQQVQQTAMSLFATSQGLYWTFLPIVFLSAILVMFATGDISGGSIERLIRRLILSVLLLSAFREISGIAVSIEGYLVNAFGGDQSIHDIFSHVAEHTKQLKDAGLLNWIRIGQMGLSLISTLSFLILALVEHFLNVLHLTLWNLVHVLAPLALLFGLFPSLSQIPTGIFVGLFELSLWRPIWVILGKILIAIGYGVAPTDPSQWFDAAIMNFSVAGMMAATPVLVHGFLSGGMVGMGGGTLQTMLGGMGAFLTGLPMRTIQGVTRGATNVAGMAAGAALKMPAALIQRPPTPRSKPAGGQQPMRSPIRPISAPLHPPKPKNKGGI